MDSFLLYMEIVILCFWVVFGIDLMVGNRSVKYLNDVRLSGPLSGPKLSVIIPARNEEKRIQDALRSVLKQDYQNIEFIIVNDRSTDRTGAILDQMKLVDSRLRIEHLTALPQGWLGKNYALYSGARIATGELILFIDADVVLQPSAISKAISYLLMNRLAHLTIGPDIKMPGHFLGMFSLAFLMFLSLYARPWKAKDVTSKRYIGIGGFNLLRVEVYHAIGTHQAIAMRPDDDLKLGKLVKRQKYRQELLWGKDMLHVEWYSSVRDMIDGLMKNMFAAVEYSVPAVVGASLAQFAFNIWPLFGIFATSHALRLINGTIMLVILFLCWDSARFYNLKRWYGIGFPFCSLLFIYIMWRSMMLALVHKGIDWRGTHYSLAELKANKV
jgi:glycosyltransferase involved in cell wall biosynthesis